MLVALVVPVVRLSLVVPGVPGECVVRVVPVSGAHLAQVADLEHVEHL